MSNPPFDIRPSGQACGAEITGIDLTNPLPRKTITALRKTWLEHHVLSFPDQAMNDDDLERFTQYFGPFGEDPFIAPIKGRKHIIAVERQPTETTPIFAEAWHTDWSFQNNPPDGTCLFGIDIPACGGDTLFANQHLALESMPETLRTKIDKQRAIHSARSGYAPDGIYGVDDKGRGMDIRPDASAAATESHLLIRKHPETGKEAVYGAFGYIIGIEMMDEVESVPLLAELYAWQTREEFQYRHQWRPNMLVMWDNRSVLHKATGGYEGQRRCLHRTTIGSRSP
ncbi:MAG: TauD/TfdA family dioxygenase [Pseudomonadota bacterium]